MGERHDQVSLLKRTPSCHEENGLENGKNEREEASYRLFQNSRPRSDVNWTRVTAVEIKINR